MVGGPLGPPAESNTRAQMGRPIEYEIATLPPVARDDIGR